MEHQKDEQEQQLTFSVEGMTCASCVRIVERQLKKIEGISYVSVNLATEKALIISQQPIDVGFIREKIRETGYTYREDAPTEDLLLKRFAAAKHNLILALSATVPVMLLMIGHMAGFMIPGFHYLELISGAFVLALPGRSVVRGAYIAVTHRHTNMDTLVTIGAVVAWLTVPLLLFGMPIASFGALSSMLITFHLAGRYIESRLKYRASTDIRALLSAQSSSANLIISTEGAAPEVRQVSIDTVKKDALVLVRTGERIPLDGEVVEGTGYVDASMVTGEPVPAAAAAGDQMIGGTVLVQGSLTLRVTHTGEDTFLSRMIKLVEQAQSSQVPIQALADQVTKVFIPIVFSIAILTALLWGLFYQQLLPYLSAMAEILPWISLEGGAFSTALSVAISILVIACPCALGLATPMALVAGSGAAAKRGMIIKDGEAIQLAKDIDIILLDKTGTITEGKPSLTYTNLTDAQLAALAAIEAYSIHPLAASIREYAEGRSLRIPEVTKPEEISGVGVSGIVDGRTYHAGRPKHIDARMEQYMSQGATVIEVTIDQVPAGFAAISDPVKEDSHRAIRQLIDAGIRPVMVTGDQQKTADAAAALVGITEVHASLHPEQKLDIVRSYQKKGHVVAMVGDGINDAASLKAADVGIALGTGSDLSIDSAGIIIVSGALSKLYETIMLSKKTFRTIRQNLFWAFVYNLIALPVAAAALLHPAMAEIAMTFSSINVILNSMRIRSFDPTASAGKHNDTEGERS
jgi:P-type Cu+ transporter